MACRAECLPLKPEMLLRLLTVSTCSISLYLWRCTSRTCHFNRLEAIVLARLYDKLNLLSFSQTSEAFRFDCRLQKEISGRILNTGCYAST